MTVNVALRLFAARACAWGLLIAAWIGLGSFALRLAPTVTAGFALVAGWLLALGAAATVATRSDVTPRVRATAIVLCAATAIVALAVAARGGGVVALAAAVLGCAALTALASGVVRALRLAQPARPRPPVAAATAGALGAAWALGDIGDLPALLLRFSIFVGLIAALLALLTLRLPATPRAPGCRAGLFDCSLPAWPAGAWRDARQWPTLLAGLAMLPMMAALPLMVAWCRSEALAAQAVVLVHVAAMFVPALALQRVIVRVSTASLSFVCALLLAAGAAALLTAPAPFDWMALAAAHGAAWSLAWSGALWAPQRRARQGSSPLRAGAGYALLTIGVGAVTAWLGARGVAAVHLALALAAVTAWVGATIVAFVARAQPGVPRVRP